MLRNLLRPRRTAAIWAADVRQLQQARTLSVGRPLHKQNYDLSANFVHTEAEGFVRHSPFNTIQPAGVRIDQFVWRDLSRWHAHTALVCGDTGRQLSYAQFRDHCAALAVRLQRKLGLVAGDVLAVCLPNCPDFAIASFAALEAELVLTPVNSVYTAEEISKQLLASNAKMIIGTADGYATLLAAVQKTKRPIRIVCVRQTPAQTLPDGAIDFAELSQIDGVDFADLRQSATCDPNAVAILPFSSGTTGLPKGVMLSHNNITTNCLQFNVDMPYRPITEPTTDTFQDCVPCVLPLFHIYGFTVTMTSKLALGCKLVTLSKFAPDTFLRAMVQHRGSLVCMVPPIINFLASHPAVEAKHLASIRHAMSGASTLSVVDVQRFMDKVNRPDCNFMQAYGMTETSPVCLMNVIGSTNYDSTGGVAPNTEAKIVSINDVAADEIERGLPANQPGELLVRGPQVMLGYLNNEAATREAIMPGGWLRTGDVGHYDEQGYFYVTDRLKELIKVKGFQVPPAELEGVLREHPLVADAAVVGVPHAINGQVPMALVVRRSDELQADELQAFVGRQVAEYKRLAGGVRFVAAIPRNATGKILRNDLKELYEA